MTRRDSKTWAALALLVLFALGAYVAAGPYLTVNAIRGAIKQQDATALSKQVDFPALRESLKLQLDDRLLRKAGADMQSNPFGALGLTIAGNLIGAGVETMVNPVGLSALVEGRKVWKHFDEGLSPPRPQAAPNELWHDARYRYESPSRFSVTALDEDGDPTVFVITRRGLRWKLSDIRLPQ